MNGTKILALTKSTGGIALYNRLLLSELRLLGADSHTICLSENAEEYASNLSKCGLSAQPMAMARYRIDPIGDLRVLMRIRSIVRSMAPDLIICHGSKPGFIGRILGRMTGCPVIYRQASLPFLRRVQGNKAPFYWVLDYLAGTLGGHLVTLTEYAKRETLAYKLARPDRITVIRTGVDVDRFCPPNDRDTAVRGLGLDASRPVVGWMGRLEPQKAPIDYVAALKIVAPKHPQAQFVIAGDGRLLDSVAQAVSDAGLSDRVTMLTWQQDPVPTLQAFDIYALSSLWEGLPLTLLEAMACGCCCVSTDVDGCAEAIDHGTTGALFASGDPQLMANALDAVLSDPDLRKRYASQGRQRAETLFNKKTMVANWIDLIGSLTSHSSVRASRSGAATEPVRKRG